MEKFKKGITFGAFDPLHYGHTRLFKRAKEQCKKLIVCVSTDLYIQINKGHNPLLKQEDRFELVGELRCVDEVSMQLIFKDERDSKLQMIRMYKPDVIFVGDDWNKKTFTGEGLGIPVIYLPYTKQISSTKIKDNADSRYF